MRRLLPLLMLVLFAGCAENSLLGPRRDFVVFFQPFSSTLDSPARAVIGRAALRARQASLAQVAVVGYADPVGAPAQNAELAADRAKVVADTLMADGVPPGQIAIGARGPVGTAGVQYRRATIRIVPPGGAPGLH